MSRRREIENRSKPNLSAKFILPMVDIFDKHLPGNFINSYITDDYQVILVFDLAGDNRFVHYLDFIRGSEYFHKTEEHEDEICIFFKIGEKYKSDYDMFKYGHYSKISEEYKQTMCKLHGVEPWKLDHQASIYNAIYPQKYKRKQIAERFYAPEDIREGLKIIEEVGEVLDKPNLDREIYKTIEQLKEEQQNKTINAERQGDTIKDHNI